MNNNVEDWLRNNVGQKGTAWDWIPAKDDTQLFGVAFKEESHALLFTLKWLST